jgi:hypothetical protein
MAVLEKWEFGSIEWCRFAAQTGVELLEKAHLDREKLEWGCSEEYTQVPARLLGSRDRAVWHFNDSPGKDQRRRFAAGAMPRAARIPCCRTVASDRTSFVGDLRPQGQQRRFAEENEMWNELRAAGRLPNERSVARPAVWPREIATALSPDARGSGGLHNFTAVRIKPSPELEGFPFTDMGVPDFSRMSVEQKERFYRLPGY